MKLSAVLITLVLISTCDSAYAAVSDREFARCAVIAGDLERLECFDTLAKAKSLDGPQLKVTSVAGIGKWRVSETKSPIDDSTNVYLSVAADKSIRSAYESVTPNLYIRCKENKTDLYINWGLYLGLDETRMLTRFDQEKAQAQRWYISTDHEAVFVQGSDIAFAKRMMAHEKLLVEITPYGESPVMTTFDIRGLTNAIAPLREACHW